MSTRLRVAPSYLPSDAAHRNTGRLPLPQIPVFVWAPEEEGQFQPGRCSRWWLMQSLRAFEKDLAALGSRLTYLRGAESRTALIDYIRDVGVQVRPHGVATIGQRIWLAVCCQAFDCSGCLRGRHVMSQPDHCGPGNALVGRSDHISSCHRLGPSA